MKRAISSIIEATQQDILTETEAEALIEFLATKFVQRRFDAVFYHVFDVGSPDRYSFRHVRGTVK